MGRGRLSRGRRCLRPGLRRGQGRDSLLAAPPAARRGPRGSQLQSPPPRTHPLRPRPLPQRPAPNLTVSPGSGWGRWASKGVDSGAQAGPKGAALSPGPPDASTDTMSHKGRKCVSTSPSGTAPRLVLSRRAEDSTSRFPSMLDVSRALHRCSLPLWGPLPQPVRPQVRAGDESINRLSNFDTSPSDNSISPFSPQAVLVVIRVIIKQ